MNFPSSTSTDRIQSRLLLLAGIFLGLYALILTLSPAARARSWDVTFRWDHWAAFGAWAVLFFLADRQSASWLPGRDPFILPVAGLLSGWGLLTIWRLSPGFGQRQTYWLMITLALFILILRLPSNLNFLRRYKYLALTAGLLLTGLTLLFGTDPSGGSERLWLGGYGLYFQPSEPLKLLLIVYLAAYMADRLPFSLGTLPLLGPTLIMVGLATLLLVVQHDLGTATVFLALYAITIYLASGQKRILAGAGMAILLAAGAGYVLFDVVRLRIEAWANPWADPSGRSFQIVQSLMAIANGGLLGRGPGIGSPGVVPVPHSDFIFSSIAEETGLIGTLALLLLISLLAARGLRAALRAPDNFRRYLAGGLTAFLVGQSVLIIGGNLRLLPLTGVTLPFVSYGGSSLLVSFLSLGILMQIGARVEEDDGEILPGRSAHRLAGYWASALINPQPYLILGGLLFTGLGAAALLSGWWTVVRADDLLARTDNPRRVIADRYVLRGFLLDRQDKALVATLGQPGSYTRHSLYPPLAAVTGYNNPFYGLSGLEASLDPYLRGEQAYSSWTLFLSRLLYGEPPPGLNVRLSLDLDLQTAADKLIGDRKAALVMLDSRSGEILVMASHPTYDPNRLESDWSQLIKDPRAPLFNRAALGQYQPGPVLGALYLAGLGQPGSTPRDLGLQVDGLSPSCAIPPTGNTWKDVLASGCPGPAAALGQEIAGGNGKNLQAFFDRLGLYTAPPIRLQVAGEPAGSPLPALQEDLVKTTSGEGQLRVSPLQLALAGAALSNDGIRPAPRLLTGIDTPQSGWVVPALTSSPVQEFPPSQAGAAAQILAAGGQPIWQTVAVAPNGPQETVTWYLGGTLPGYSGTPLTVTLLLEENNPSLALQIGQTFLTNTLQH